MKTKWKTVKFAPKDGEHFLAFDGRIFVCRWDVIYGGFLDESGTVRNITHWMKLPDWKQIKSKPNQTKPSENPNRMHRAN